MRVFPSHERAQVARQEKEKEKREHSEKDGTGASTDTAEVARSEKK